jgi:hypothetical protein
MTYTSTLPIGDNSKTGAQLEPIIMSTVCGKTLPLKQNKCVVNQLKHFDDISFRELFRSIRVAQIHQGLLNAMTYTSTLPIGDNYIYM